MAFLLNAGTPRIACWFVMKRLRELKDSRDSKLAEVLEAVPRVAPAIAASGFLAEVVTLVVAASHVEPLPAERCVVGPPR